MAANRIREIRKAQGLSQRDLAKLLGAHWVTVSKLERGEMQMTMEWVDRLRDVLKVSLTQLAGDEPDRFEIPIYGWIDERGAIQPSADPNVTVDLRPSAGLDAFSYWLLVGSDVFWPIFREGDLLKFLAWPIDEYQDCYDRLCILTQDGGQELAGILSPPRGTGVAMIKALNGPSVEVANIATIAVIDEARFQIKQKM